MSQDRMSAQVQTLAREKKENCTTEEDRLMLDDFVSCGIAKLTLDVDLLYQEVEHLLNSK